MLNILKEQYGLTEDDLDQEISQSHVDTISRRYCACWKLLPSNLQLDSIVVNDIENSTFDETERRHKFFRKWKKIKGSDASYKRLIIALLEVDDREDAEKVCKLLQKGRQTSGRGELEPDSEATAG